MLARDSGMTNEPRTDRKKRTSTVLKILLIITALLALLFVIFDFQHSLEITGFLFFVLLFWVITEIAGGKSTASHESNRTGASPVWKQVKTDAKIILNGLPESCAVFSDINTGYGNIDFIILSKENGLFIVECKQHPGTITATDSKLIINGVEPEQDFFVKILWYTFWLNEKVKTLTKLDAAVTPMVVFTNASVEVSDSIRGVIITDRNSILRNIQKIKVDPQIAASLWSIYGSGVVMW